MPKKFLVPKQLKGIALEDYILANHPYFVRRRKRAMQRIAQGEFVTAEELRALGEQKTTKAR